MLLLFIVGIFAGLIEASAGGSGLISLPAILLFGYQPIQAMATSKFQYAFGALTAIFRFSRAGLIAWRKILPLLATSLVSGALGAYLLSKVETQILAVLIPFVLIALALYFGLSSRMSDRESLPRIGWSSFAVFVVPIIAFYDGFFGVGSASLYVAAFTSLLGMSARAATANTKLVDFASGGAALVVLAFQGHVLLAPGLALGLGQMLGAYFGASLVVKWGLRWVKPLVVLVSIGLSIDLVYRHWDRFADVFGLSEASGALP